MKKILFALPYLLLLFACGGGGGGGGGSNSPPEVPLNQVQVSESRTQTHLSLIHI